MIRNLFLSFLVLFVSAVTFAQISTLPANESFTTTFTQGAPATFIPNWTGSNVAASSKIFQDLTDFNSAPAALWGLSCI